MNRAIKLGVNRRWWRRFAWLAFVAGLFATFVALTAFLELCPQSDVGTCAEGEGPEWTLIAQLVAAVLALAATGLMLAATLLGKKRGAQAGLVAALVLYAGWAVLLSAATD
jgi:hypothetical protein